MHIIISGGAGFVGSHLVDYYLKKGYKVTVLDNLSTGSLENLQRHKNLAFYNVNVAQDSSTFGIRVPGPADAVLHFASAASPVDYGRMPVQTLLAGSLGTLNCLRLADDKGAKFLFASTSEVYGDPLVHPQPESYWGNVNPVGARSCYDEAKRFGEALSIAYGRHENVPVKIVRIFNTIGPRMRREDGRAVPNFIVQAISNRPLTVYGAGCQTRSICYVDDLVLGIDKMLNLKITGPVNLGNPEEITMLDLAKKIKALTGSCSKIVFKPLPPDDPTQRRPDIRLAKKSLGWSPKISLDDALLGPDESGGLGSTGGPLAHFHHEHRTGKATSPARPPLRFGRGTRY